MGHRYRVDEASLIVLYIAMIKCQIASQVNKKNDICPFFYLQYCCTGTSHCPPSHDLHLPKKKIINNLVSLFLCFDIIITYIISINHMIIYIIQALRSPSLTIYGATTTNLQPAQRPTQCQHLNQIQGCTSAAIWPAHRTRQPHRKCSRLDGAVMWRTTGNSSTRFDRHTSN